MLLSEPPWGGPGTGPPPLSMDDAVRIAKEEIPTYLGDPVDLKVTGVELRSLCCPERWFYVVSFYLPKELGDSLPIPVLLSGHAVKLNIGGIKP
jgi:hypothetical protein